jgi:hypothetical protein
MKMSSQNTKSNHDRQEKVMKKQHDLAAHITRESISIPSLPFSCKKPPQSPTSTSFLPCDRHIRYVDGMDGSFTLHRSTSLLHMHEADSKDCDESNHQGEGNTYVSNLTWRDEHGNMAKYTGKVQGSDQKMLPHGYGYLVYDDGEIFTSMWFNGIPLKSLQNATYEP